MSNVALTAWKSHDPSRPQLPYDLLYQIVELVDFETVKSYSLVNRDCRDASSSRLWRSFTINVGYQFTKGNYKLGSEFLRCMTKFILTTPRRENIQDLRVRLHAPIGLLEGEDLMIIQGIEYLLEGIHRLRNLHSLELHALVHQHDFAYALRGMTFSTQLERFATNLHSLHIQSFDELFSTMRSIKSIQWMANSLISKPDRLIAPLKNPLPNLTKLVTWSPPYTALMCGSPVTHLTVHDIRAGEPQEMLRHIRQSTRDLTHLEVGIDANYPPSPTMALCSSLVEHIPSLRYLKISLRSFSTYDYREEGFESIRILGSRLPLLEEFVWLGGRESWQGQLFEMMEWESFSALRRAMLSWETHYGQHKTKYFIKESGKAMLTEVLRHEYV